jgi:hypothetical protein
VVIGQTDGNLADAPILIELFTRLTAPVERLPTVLRWSRRLKLRTRQRDSNPSAGQGKSVDLFVNIARPIQNKIA